VLGTGKENIHTPPTGDFWFDHPLPLGISQKSSLGWVLSHTITLVGRSANVISKYSLW